ncbi:MAG: peroxidase-related enzyme [Planctomycetes bacterium]|nr:peroxidase-related enzyme [Planctomycetota bacterium]
MSRIPAVDPSRATGQTAELLAAVEQKMGRVPNMMRVLANGPAGLSAYLAFSGALGDGRLPAALREQIALAVAEINQCDYCLSAHAAIGKMVGLDAAAIAAARAAGAGDPKATAVLVLARSLVVNRGNLTDAELTAARRAGLDDGEIVEVVANVALNIFTNYLNHVAATDVDFPKVDALAATRSA